VRAIANTQPSCSATVVPRKRARSSKVTAKRLAGEVQRQLAVEHAPGEEHEHALGERVVELGERVRVLDRAA